MRTYTDTKGKQWYVPCGFAIWEDMPLEKRQALEKDYLPEDPPELDPEELKTTYVVSLDPLLLKDKP